MFVKVYADTAPTNKSCRKWSRRFKDGDFTVEDKPRSGQPKKFEDKELEARKRSESNARRACKIIGGNSTSRFCIESHGNDSKTRKLPYELKPRDVERRFFTCEFSQLTRQQRKGFFASDCDWK